MNWKHSARRGRKRLRGMLSMGSELFFSFCQAIEGAGAGAVGLRVSSASLLMTVRRAQRATSNAARWEHSFVMSEGGGWLGSQLRFETFACELHC